MRLLIDADVLPYSIGYAFNREGDKLSVAKLAMNRRIDYIQSYIKERFKTINGTQVKSVTLYLSNDDVKNFRYEVAKTQPYKGNRVDVVKPQFYKQLKQELIKRKDSIVVEGIEADDQLGIEASKNPVKTIIVSMDKDLRMISGWHWEMDDTRHPFYVDDPGYLVLEKRSGYTQLFGTGTHWLYAQMLMGDKADNIPGLKGYGPKKAYDTLIKYKELNDEVVKGIYNKAGCLNRFEEVKELLWILRENREKKEMNGQQKDVTLK